MCAHRAEHQLPVHLLTKPVARYLPCVDLWCHLHLLGTAGLTTGAKAGLGVGVGVGVGLTVVALFSSIYYARKHAVSKKPKQVSLIPTCLLCLMQVVQAYAVSHKRSVVAALALMLHSCSYCYLALL